MVTKNGRRYAAIVPVALLDLLAELKAKESTMGEPALQDRTGTSYKADPRYESLPEPWKARVDELDPAARGEALDSGVIPAAAPPTAGEDIFAWLDEYSTEEREAFASTLAVAYREARGRDLV